MNYLMIENEGVAPVESFTLLGMSTTRKCDVEGVIGQFGSGTKHAINLLLRKGIEFHIYCGNTCLEFFFVEETIDDGLGETEAARVKCRLKGGSNKTIDCGWVLDFGALDWDETSMAIREFVSNAIDRTIRQKGSFKDSSLKVEPAEIKRAKSGCTRIFIRMTDKVFDYYNDLGRNFLHFSSDPEQVSKRFLTKDRSSIGPRIYREGVFIRELKSSYLACFDYNFEAADIKIDECRNSSEYSLRADIARKINKAEPKTLAFLFSLMSRENVFEAGLDDYYLGFLNNSAQKKNWQEGWRLAHGSAVIADYDENVNPIHEHAKRKGHKIVSIKSKSFVSVAERMGILGVCGVLGEHEGAGHVEAPVTKHAVEAVDTVWSWIEETGLTEGKKKPKTKCFQSLMDGGCETLGYHTFGTSEVNIREDLSGKQALKCALEEVAHYLTGATDCSRDFQQFFIEMISRTPR